MPYFNADDTKQGLILHGEMVDLNTALTEIKSKETTIEEIDEFIATLPYYDAPPCLQTMFLLNMMGKNSGRNNYLFSFGVFLKKKDENYFEQELMEINNSMNSPLSVEEVETTLLSSLRKKDYTYKCTVSPCLDYCDKKICKNKEYGIGKNDGYFTNLILGSMIQYNTSEPYYEWNVKIKEDDSYSMLRFKDENEIIKQDTFLKLTMRKLHFLPFKMKQVEWFKLVNQALQDLTIIEVKREDDTSSLSIFLNIFYSFLTSRAFATTYDQMIGGRVYYNSKTDEYYFRTKDILDYLYTYKNFKLFQPREVHGILRDIGSKEKRIRTESKRHIRVAVISKSQLYEVLGVNSEENEVFEADFSEYENIDEKGNIIDDGSF